MSRLDYVIGSAVCGGRVRVRSDAENGAHVKVMFASGRTVGARIAYAPRTVLPRGFSLVDVVDAHQITTKADALAFGVYFGPADAPNAKRCGKCRRGDCGAAWNTANGCDRSWMIANGI